MASTETDGGNSSMTFRQGLGRKASSILRMARMSFARSGGQRGASVDSLRGTNGADFESGASVERCGGEGLSFSFFGGSSMDKSVFVMIKGPFCFVFKNEKASSPKYAIELARMKAEVRDSASSGTVAVVALQSSLGDDEYLFRFPAKENPDVGTEFAQEVQKQAAAGEAEMVRKRLGHESLLDKRASMKFAEGIAKKKVNEQPEKPLGAAEVLENMPMTAM